MKISTGPLVFGLAAILGCASPRHNAEQARQPHRPRMAYAEVIAVAQRLIPLTENESYRAEYLDDGVWRLVDEPHPGFNRITFKAVLIRDSDGSLFGITSY